MSEVATEESEGGPVADITADKSLLQLVAEAAESEPLESQKLRKGEALETVGGTVNSVLKSSGSKLTKELRCELAVTAVKRAFSQCPNLSLLVRYPLISMRLSRPSYSCSVNWTVLHYTDEAPLLTLVYF